MRRFSRTSLTWLLAFTGTAALLAASAPNANAQESVPNDACTTAGLFRQSSGADPSNSGYTLFCDGTRWVGMIEYRSTGDLYFSSTGAIALPDGTTAQRPVPPVAGMIRYNSTLDTFEGYVGGAVNDWEDLLGAAAGGTDVSFYAYRSGSGQSFPGSDTITKVNFTNELFDTNGDFDTSTDRFTPTVAGTYILTARGSFNAGTTFSLIVYKNGTPYSSGSWVGTDIDNGMVVTTIAEANGTTDYFEVRLINSGSTRTADFGPAELYFSGALVGGGGGGGGLSADTVLESHLKSVNAATDEYCLTYETTTGDFEWQACGGASLWTQGTGDNIYYNAGTAPQVGIGTTAPGAKLHSNVTSTAGNTILEALRLSHEDTNSGGAAGIGAALTFNLETATNATFREAARIVGMWDDATDNSKDGSLCFWTMGPNAVSGTTATEERACIWSNATNQAALDFAVGGTVAATINFPGAGSGAITMGALGGSYRTLLSFANDGAVSVGEADAGADVFTINGVGSQTGDYFNITSDGGADGDVLTIDSGGFVGINDTSPDVELSVVGDIEYTGTIADVSDRRLKKDIENLTAGQLERLIRLQGVSFKMISDEEGRTELGLIAQDVQDVFPELVQEGGSGTLSLNYSGLIAPMIEAIKEQQAQITQQRAELDDLKAMNAALVTRVEKLEAASANP